MSKKLEEMSLKELWQLFPIFLVKHNKEWMQWYGEERREIKSSPHKQLIMDIGKTKYTVNLHFKQGKGKHTRIKY